MAIQVNTAAVADTAAQIDTLNCKLRDDFSSVDGAVKSLRSKWEGNGANACMNKFDFIKRELPDARFTVINNLVVFLKVKIDEGYETTESSVSSAALAFK